MSYDWLNRQTSWTDGTNTETQTYRGSSWKRVSTTVNGTQVKYLYDGDNVISDYDSNNALIAFYVTPFLDQNISLTNSSGTSYYYTQDGLGSVRSLTNGAGAIVNKYDYTAFGEVYAGNTAEQLANRYTYTGREKSSLSSAGAPMYYRWRSYSPQIGRFLWRDPIGYNDGVNIYAYVGNKVVNNSDSHGLHGSGQPTACCDGKDYDLTTHFCCGGNIYANQGKYCCKNGVIGNLIPYWKKAKYNSAWGCAFKISGDIWNIVTGIGVGILADPINPRPTPPTPPTTPAAPEVPEGGRISKGGLVLLLMVSTLHKAYNGCQSEVCELDEAGPIPLSPISTTPDADKIETDIGRTLSPKEKNIIQNAMDEAGYL